jgi:inner membrane transporter RhtA
MPNRSTGTRDLRSIVWATACILLAMASVQTGAAFAKTLFVSVGAEGATALRTGFGALMLVAVWRPWRGRLNVRQIRMLVAFGSALGLMNLLFYCALRTLPLGVAVAIEFTGPFTLALLLSRRLGDLIWLALAVAGLGVLLPLDDIATAADPEGVAFALGAGACWALYIVFGQKLAAILPAGRAAALGVTVAALMTLPFGIVHAGWAMASPAVVAVALGVAVLSSALPYSLEMVALKRLPARTFGVLMSLEPALAAAAGGLFLGEALSFRQSMGVACIILASLGSTRQRLIASR